MKLIDQLMKEICDEMEWSDIHRPDSNSGAIRQRIAPVAAAYDAVREAVDEALERMEPITDDLPDGLYNLLSVARSQLEVVGK